MIDVLRQLVTLTGGILAGALVVQRGGWRHLVAALVVLWIYIVLWTWIRG